MDHEKIEYEVSSGNIFRDFGDSPSRGAPCKMPSRFYY